MWRVGNGGENVTAVHTGPLNAQKPVTERGLINNVDSREAPADRKKQGVLNKEECDTSHKGYITRAGILSMP